MSIGKITRPLLIIGVAITAHLFLSSSAAHATGPTITSISPTTGSAAGARVTFTGTSLNSLTNFNIGGVPCDSFTRITDTQVACTTRSTDRTDVPLEVRGTSSDGSTTIGMQKFTFYIPPFAATVGDSVTAIGSGTVALAGNGLNCVRELIVFDPTTSTTVFDRTSYSYPGNNYDFCNSGSWSYLYFSNALSSYYPESDTQLLFDLPASANPGKYSVKLISPWGQVKTFSDAIVVPPYPTPTITSIDPATGSANGGNYISINGTNLSHMTSWSIGQSQISTQFADRSATTLLINVPQDPTNETIVQGMIYSGTINLPFTYTYVFPAAPTVSDLTVTSGSTDGGTSTIIHGSGFTNATAIRFGSTVQQNFTIISDTSLAVVAPSSIVAGQVSVSVSNRWTTGSLNNGFTYIAPALPTVTGITPTSALVINNCSTGYRITISGTDLNKIQSVTIGSSGVSRSYFIAQSDSLIVLNVPCLAVGTYQIQLLTNLSQISAPTTFTISPQPSPTITSISPSSGSANGGTVITIVGTNLGIGTQITIGATFANVTSYVDTTSVTAITGASSFIAPVDVVVTTASGNATLSRGFTYTTPPAPAISSISVSSGSVAGGTSVTLTGTGFTGVNAITVGGVNADYSQCCNFVISDTQIRFTTRAGSQSGSAEIDLFNRFSKYAFTGLFTYTALPAPIITSASTGTLPATGGQLILYGTNLNGVTSVSSLQYPPMTIQYKTANQLVLSAGVANSLGTSAITTVSTGGVTTIQSQMLTTGNPVAPTLGNIQAYGTAPNMQFNISNGSGFLGITGCSVPGAYCGIDVSGDDTAHIYVNDGSGALNPGALTLFLVNRWGGMIPINSGFYWLNQGLAPSLSGVTQRAGGFTFTITNYDPNYTYAATASNGTITQGPGNNSTHILPFTVSGLTAGQGSTVSLSITRIGYSQSNININGTALSNATGYTVSGPSAGAIGAAATFTITPNGVDSGTITISFSGGGLSTPIVKTFVDTNTAQSFTINPSAGNVTLTFTNSNSLTNPSPLTYVVGALTTTPIPTISGTAQVGQTLTATPGNWDAGTNLSYQWMSDTSTTIASATKSTYLPVAADTGRRISVVVTGTKAGYTLVTRSSLQTAPIVGLLIATPTPRISGTVQAGQTLTAVTGTWDSGVTFTYQWSRSSTNNGASPSVVGTNSTYLITNADKGKYLYLIITGSKAGYASVTSARSAITIQVPNT